ncbi:MAG: hypothetical protein ACXV2C_00735 [Candidatus Bathyarchaeia archaeon]
MSDLYSKFLTLKYLRDEIAASPQRKVYKLATPEQRLAVEQEYQFMLQFVLERIEVDYKVRVRERRHG